MGKHLLFLLLPFCGWSQPLPPSESSSYAYDKYQYGFDFLNTYSLFEAGDGSLICNPYQGSYYVLRNNTATLSLRSAATDEQLLQNYIPMPGGVVYYCTSRAIKVVKYGRVVSVFLLNSSHDDSRQYALWKGNVYFLTQLASGVRYLRCFSGKKVETLLRLRDHQNGWQHQLTVSKGVFIMDWNGNRLEVSLFDNSRLHFVKQYKTKKDISSIPSFRDENNFVYYDYANAVCEVRSGKEGVSYTRGHIYQHKIEDYIVVNQGADKVGIGLKGKSHPIFNTTAGENINSIIYNKESNSYYCGTGTQLLRLFPYLRKYPRLFNSSNSNTVFTLQQDSHNQIWAASYQGALAIIDGDRVMESSVRNIRFMNGGMRYKNKMVLLGESDEGILLFDDRNHYRKIMEGVTGYYLYPDHAGKLYFGTCGKGLWYADVSALEAKTPLSWRKVTAVQGLRLSNILTICEDRFGNIWMGRGSQGIAVYNPQTGIAKTWLVEKKEIKFGSNATIRDSHGTLWFGTNSGGLCFYNGKDKEDLNPRHFIPIVHPLLENGMSISFLHQWKDFLILGAGNKVLLFDLRKWYANRTVRVRYLNPIEGNFTNTTEQNSILTDRKDGAIWFSTSDMVYRWDIEKWRALPTLDVHPTVSIRIGANEDDFDTERKIKVGPLENNFELRVHYQSKDNMPRFINGSLVKYGTPPTFGHPALESTFSFSNLSAGDYVFYVRTCQADGRVSIDSFNVTIERFFWEYWWFKTALFLMAVALILYYYRKKQQLLQQKRRLSQLTLSSLGNQFRPHFMLNVLNSIGAQMREMPHAEKVISRLGESIDILYDFSLKNSFIHDFPKEWKLVENIIDIQKLLFIPELRTVIEGVDVIPPDYYVPVGLLQIPVENALLHGLRNKTDGDCVLQITFSQTDAHYHIIIADNGVGRDRARKINNFRKNGNGLKTIEEMITIINSFQAAVLQFEITDRQPTGTRVTIKLDKKVNYEKIGI